MKFSPDAVEARESACQRNYRTEVKAVHSTRSSFVEVYSRAVDEFPTSQHELKLREKSGDGSSQRVGGYCFELGCLLRRAESSGIGQREELLRVGGEGGEKARRKAAGRVRRRSLVWGLVSFGGLKAGLAECPLPVLQRRQELHQGPAASRQLGRKSAAYWDPSPKHPAVAANLGQGWLLSGQSVLGGPAVPLL